MALRADVLESPWGNDHAEELLHGKCRCALGEGKHVLAERKPVIR